MTSDCFMTICVFKPLFFVVNISAMPPMLSENPANDDSGRFLPNGGNSMPMQYQKGNADANNPMVDKTVVKKSETFSSD